MECCIKHTGTKIYPHLQGPFVEKLLLSDYVQNFVKSAKTMSKNWFQRIELCLKSVQNNNPQ